MGAGLLAAVLPLGCALVAPTTVDTATLPPPLLIADVRSAPPRAALPDTPLTLEQALVVALANNPDLVGGGWNVEAARARKRQASSEHWPVVGLFGAYRHHWHEERLVPARGQSATEAAFSRDIFAGDVVLSVPLFSGGRVVSAVAASDLLAQAAERRLARTREELVFNVKSTYYAILGQRKLVDAILHSQRALTEHLRRTEQLIEARKAARVDLLNLQVRLAELEHRLVRQRGLVALHERLLLSLIGIETTPTGGLRLEGELAPRAAAFDGEKVLERALATRPDVAELDLQIEAQARRVDVARSEYWPAVYAKGTYGSRASIQGDYDDLGFVGLEMSVPIFTGGLTAARVEEAQAQLRSLQERKRKLVLTVRREVDSAVIQVTTAAAEVAATEKSIAMAEESLRITREKATLGHATSMDVLDAQAALLGAETTYFAALADLYTAIALLELAAGGAS